MDLDSYQNRYPGLLPLAQSFSCATCPRAVQLQPREFCPLRLKSADIVFLSNWSSRKPAYYVTRFRSPSDREDAERRLMRHHKRVVFRYSHMTTSK